MYEMIAELIPRVERNLKTLVVAGQIGTHDLVQEIPSAQAPQKKRRIMTGKIDIDGRILFVDPIISIKIACDIFICLSQFDIVHRLIASFDVEDHEVNIVTHNLK
ncbi:hypothetical protein ACJX0J_039565, partial [Zea mays]